MASGHIDIHYFGKSFLIIVTWHASQFQNKLKYRNSSMYRVC